jgi:hypothetical protein
MKKIVSRILVGVGFLCVIFVSILFGYSFIVALHEMTEILGWKFLWIIPGVIVAYIIGWLLERYGL